MVIIGGIVNRFQDVQIEWEYGCFILMMHKEQSLGIILQFRLREVGVLFGLRDGHIPISLHLIKELSIL